MDRKIGSFLLPCLALAALPSPAHAAEDACTAAERTALAARDERAAAALREGDVRKWAEVTRSKSPALSAACRKQQVRVSPATDRCTHDEKLLVLKKQKQSLRAATEFDFEGTVTAVEELRDGVSSACWIALSYPQDPEIQAYCSDEDLLDLAKANRSWPEEAHRILSAAKGEDARAVEARDEPALSLVCQAAVAKARAERRESAGLFGGTPLTRGPLAPAGSAPGTFLVPGVGACTPKACLVL